MTPPRPERIPLPVEARRFVPLHLRFQPLLFLASAFAAGIALGRGLPARPILWGPIAIGLWFVSLLVRNSRAFVPLILISYGMAGILHLQLTERRSSPLPLRALYERGIIAAGEPARVIGRLVAPPEHAPQRVYLTLDVEHVVAFKHVHCTSGRLRVMVTVADPEARAALERLGLRYGRRVHALVRIVRPERYRNPGSPPYDEYLELRGYDLAAVSKSPVLMERLDAKVLLPGDIRHPTRCARFPQPGLVERLAARALASIFDVKEMLEQDLDRAFQAAGLRTVGLVKALLLGNRHFLDARVAEAFRAGGTFHLLVISGVHVGFLATLLFGIVSQYTRRLPLRALGTLLPLWGYALMVGGDPPVQRATVMVTAFVLASLLFRQTPAANSLGLAALLLLALNPRQLFSPSFQLSFAAAGSLALLVAPLFSRLQAIGAWQPTPEHPYPPRSPELVRAFAECLFWDERTFQREQKRSPIRFQLEKAGLARTLNRLRLQPIVRALILSVLVSLIVQLALLPLMIEYFHRVALIGIVLNVIVSVLVALLGVTALATLACFFWNVDLATPLATLSHRITDATIASSALALRLPELSFRVPDYSGAGALIYLVYWIAILYFAYRLHAWNPLDRPHAVIPPTPSPGRARIRYASSRWIPWGFASAFLLGLGLLIVHPFTPARPKGWLFVHFLDVGHGDAALIEFPDGTTMLLDAGGEVGPFSPGASPTPGTIVEGEEPEFLEDRPPIGEAVVSTFLWSRGLTRIDYVVPTHAHADHMRGFLDVIRNFEIGSVLLARRPARDPLFASFLRAVEQRRIPIIELQQGDRLWIGPPSAPSVTATVLWPPPDPQPEGWGNEESLVLRLQYGEISILFPGDIERTTEEALLISGQELRSDVLKVPHHGSRTSSSEPFLDRVRPRWAIVSAADPTTSGRFRYPPPDVRERYERRMIPLLHTGEQGLITLLTDGRTIRIHPWDPRVAMGPRAQEMNPGRPR